MPVSLDKAPGTPAEVAGAVLDEIAAHPGNFEMAQWTTLGPGEELSPSDVIGSVRLCAASWVARVMGWTLIHGHERVVTTDRWGEEDDETYLYAERGSERRAIDSLAEEALGLTGSSFGSFWTVSEERAIERLREIAGRE